jgi:malate dehydrogenase (oxaloacetate-decarboxylating)
MARKKTSKRKKGARKKSKKKKASRKKKPAKKRSKRRPVKKKAQKARRKPAKKKASKKKAPKRELTEEEKIAKAKKPGQDAMILHPFYKGKVEVTLKAPVRDFKDFAIWYTPGVAEPCRDIHKNPEKVFEHTNKANVIAVVSDGTRVLGLGDIGPEAGLPVMEGKALLFKYLGGVDAVPLCIDTKDPDEIINFVLQCQPSFGGINLEDISHPKCFYILDTLRKKARIPVWHDDQQGTATITVAGLLNALKIVGKKINEATIAMIGAGAANIAIARVMITAGVDPKNMVFTDSRGIIHPGREDADVLKDRFKEKWHYALTTNKEGKTGDVPDAMMGVDVVCACSRPGPGVIKPEWVKAMADDAIVFSCANPTPEIWPWDAKEAGAAIVSTGRSDFPNQINNSLGFPGIFRGTLDVMATTITDEMCIAAAYELANLAEEKGLDPEAIVPTMDDWEVFPREAAAVGKKAVEQGVARIKDLSYDEIYKMAKKNIKRARDQTKIMMKQGYIRKAPV